MAQVHFYLLIEAFNLNATQRDTLIDAIRALGKDDASTQPARRMQLRKRLDNGAGLFEAVFDEADLTVAQFKTRLANLFGVSVASISNANSQNTYGTLASLSVMFSRTGTDYLRFTSFGLTGAYTPTWDESRLEAIAYLKANAVAWGEEVA